MKRPAHTSRRASAAPARPLARSRPAREHADVSEFGAPAECSSAMEDLLRRARAEVRKRRGHPEPGWMGAPFPGAQRLQHELQVHQVELEMQNASLLEARNQMELLLDKYTKLYDYAPVGYFTLDRQGRILEVNLTGAALLGLERSRLHLRPLSHVVAPASRPTLQTFLDEIFVRSGKESCEARLLKANSTEFWASLHGTRGAAATGTQNQCWLMVSDLTAAKAADDKVRVSEVRYRRLFEAAQDGVLIVDPETTRIIDANPFMTTLLDRPREQLTGRKLVEIGLLQDEAASKGFFRTLSRQHEIRYDDLSLEGPTGRRHDLEVVASLYRENGRAVIQCNIRDITERRQVEAAERRLAVLSASNLKLEAEVIHRRAVERSLKESQQEQSRLLTQAHALQEQLRDLSRAVLRAQEEERHVISRELHDVVAQTLTGIHLRLEHLKQQADVSPARLRRNIAATRRLVAQSLETVHQFARDLRPPVLDDLGLIPALRGYLESLAASTGLRTRLIACAEVEQLNEAGRTTFYRVAQEALTNVIRHARAQCVEVRVQQEAAGFCMKIVDDGKSFQAEPALQASGGNCLGLVGMRERLEMVGGTLKVVSVPGAGTTIEARIPSPRKRRRNSKPNQK